MHDDYFALLGVDRRRAHLRVVIMLVAEHHHQHQAAAVLLVIDQLCSAIGPNGHSPFEAACPVIAERHALLVLQQKRPIDLVTE